MAGETNNVRGQAASMRGFYKLQISVITLRLRKTVDQVRKAGEPAFQKFGHALIPLGRRNIIRCIRQHSSPPTHPDGHSDPLAQKVFFQIKRVLTA